MTDKEDSQDKQEKEEDNKKKKSAFQNIPPMYKVFALAIIFFVFQRTKIQESSSQTLFIVAAGILVIFYFLSQGEIGYGLKPPRWQVAQIEKRIKEMKEDGQMDRFTKYWIDIQGGYKYYSKNPDYYMNAVTFREPGGRVDMTKAKVTQQGFVTFSISYLRITGEELTMRYPIIPENIEMIRKYKLEKMLYGGGDR